MVRTANGTSLRLRVVFADGSMIGPGKADLLELIAETGSISAAGRRLGMSYKRAWTLVETMNTIFREPLVTRTRGGVTGGGAVLTAAGRRALEHYRRLQNLAGAAGAEEIEALAGMLKDMAGRQ